MAILTLAGKQHILNVALGKVAASAFIVRLGKNDVTPNEDDDFADYTEADFTGYSQVVTAPASWVVTPSVVEGESIVSISHPTVEFTSNLGGQNQSIYTAYIVTQVGNILIAADRFSPTQIANPIMDAGDKKIVTPSITVMTYQA